MKGPTDNKLFDRLRDAVRLKYYSIRTEEAYANWIERYIYFHDVRHPAEMGAPEVRGFLTHLAVDQNVAACTQNQALSALLFLNKGVLHQDLGPIDAVRRKMGPTKAIAMRKFRTQGPFLHLLQGASRIVRWVEVLRTIPTEFDGDYAQYDLPGE